MCERLPAELPDSRSSNRYGSRLWSSPTLFVPGLARKDKRMKKPALCLSCLFALLFAGLCFGASRSLDPAQIACSKRIDTLRHQAMDFLRVQQLDSVVVRAYRIEQLSDNEASMRGENGRWLHFKALSYAGELYLATNGYDRAKVLLDQAMQIWNELKREAAPVEDFYPACVMYNALGLYEIKERMNYETATELFIAGLELARKYSSPTDYAVMYYNLIMSCFVREDPSGLKYALELYEDGKALDSQKMIFMGEYSAAMMYYVAGDYERAREFVVKAIDSPYSRIDRVGIRCLYANILTSLGDYRRAGEYFRSVWVHEDGQPDSRSSYLGLSYGEYLLKVGKPDSARLIFFEGLRLASDKQDRVFAYRLYDGLARADAALGRFEDAYRHQRIFKEKSDSIFTIKRERAINELTIKYESAKHAAIIQKQNNQLQVLILSSLAVLIILVIVVYMYRKKDRMYGAMARQYKESTFKEQKLEKMILRLREEKRSLEEQVQTCMPEIDATESRPAASDASAASAAPAAGGSDQEKIDELFARLEELMTSEHLYHEANLTRTRVAELLGTNRTYFSQAINEKTGKNFNQFVNGYRIAEALQILSDPNNDTSMKAIAIEAGFGTPNTFFKIFRTETGMTPSKYREKIIECCNDNLPI